MLLREETQYRKPEVQVKLSHEVVTSRAHSNPELYLIF